MSSFTLEIQLSDSYLVAKGYGRRNTLAEVLEGTRQIAMALSETKSKYLLVDYSEVVTRLLATDAFNIVRIYESRVSEFQDIVMAVVINPAEEQFDAFWEKICRIRGYQFKIFTDRQAAEDWLKDKIDQH
ncbi:MAG: hypothetical protein KF725_13465 [Cyclobacteriaceae bacterium]|nr:hypothetical protein [Cyclobacteriaceae bacterium]UYN85369.1 MAG: hypothetical protein KIT51_10750 [Cyclobacteriaceae bacterium]